MKLVCIEYLIEKGAFSVSSDWTSVITDIRMAIAKVMWPPGNSRFVINPSRGRGRGEGNGVKPIKDACMVSLQSRGWVTNERSNPYRLDAVKHLSEGHYFGLEWETGNVSSSHRSVNRILLAHQQDNLIGGVIIVPTRSMYRFLTDRVGNFKELTPYFALWRSYPWKEGLLVIISVEHDDTDDAVPRISKGTDGRALV